MSKKREIECGLLFSSSVDAARRRREVILEMLGARKIDAEDPAVKKRLDAISASYLDDDGGRKRWRYTLEGTTFRNEQQLLDKMFAKGDDDVKSTRITRSTKRDDRDRGQLTAAPPSFAQKETDDSVAFVDDYMPRVDYETREIDGLVAEPPIAADVPAMCPPMEFSEEDAKFEDDEDDAPTSTKSTEKASQGDTKKRGQVKRRNSRGVVRAAENEEEENVIQVDDDENSAPTKKPRRKRGNNTNAAPIDVTSDVVPSIARRTRRSLAHDTVALGEEYTIIWERPSRPSASSTRTTGRDIPRDANEDDKPANDDERRLSHAGRTKKRARKAEEEDDDDVEVVVNVSETSSISDVSLSLTAATSSSSSSSSTANREPTPSDPEDDQQLELGMTFNKRRGCEGFYVSHMTPHGFAQKCQLVSLGDLLVSIGDNFVANVGSTEELQLLIDTSDASSLAFTLRSCVRHAAERRRSNRLAPQEWRPPSRIPQPPLSWCLPLNFGSSSSSSSSSGANRGRWKKVMESSGTNPGEAVDLTLSDDDDDDDDERENGDKKDTIDEERETPSMELETKATADEDEEVQIVTTEASSSSSTTAATTTMNWTYGQLVVTHLGTASVLRWTSGAQPELVVALHWGVSHADTGRKWMPVCYITSPQDIAKVRDAMQVESFVWHGHRVTESDKARLYPGLFLNDTLVDLFLEREMERYNDKLEHTSRGGGGRAHAFNSHFYPKLVNCKNNLSGVASWTRAIEIFSMDYLFIPVADKLHWSLIVICFPGRILSRGKEKNDSAVDEDRREEEVATKESPNPAAAAKRRRKSTTPSNSDTTTSTINSGPPSVILKMDSTKGHRTAQVAKTVRAWLQSEALLKCNMEINADTLTMPAVAPPSLPQQQNGCDCGVFVLEFARRFLAEAAEDFGKTCTTEEELREECNRRFPSTWFTQKDVERRRVDLMRELDPAVLNGTSSSSSSSSSSER